MAEPRFDPEPEVILEDKFHNSAYSIVVATARTCYASVPITPENALRFKGMGKEMDSARAKEMGEKVARNIFDSVYEAGHHTTIQHPHYLFLIKKVSRHFIWSFLHSHPFYDSEQVSQRYVEMKKENFVTPPLEGRAAELYENMVHEQMQGYFDLIELSREAIAGEYYRIFPARRRTPEKWEEAIHKKTLEFARYVIPIATTAFLHHTVSGLTLLRYYKLAQQFDTPLETRAVVGKMIDLGRQSDPEYFSKAIDPIPLEQTPEYTMFTGFFGNNKVNPGAAAFVKDHDARLGGLQSKLIDWKANAERTMAQSVRDVFGVSETQLSDDAAIDSVLHPAKNPLLGSTLNLTTISKLARALNHPHYTFLKKLSHTADSQDQRHRMTPGTRPVMAGHFNPEKPDCIWPMAYEKNPALMDKARRIAEHAWKTIDALLNEGVPWEYAQYLLPNAVAVRFTESGDLLNQHHKWHTRLCYLAQEEIWRTCKEEVAQVADVHPRLAKHIAAPCTMRKEAGLSPYCPEGKKFCGVPVWKFDVKDYQRTI